ncbi:WD repeat-containing protein 88 [Mesoplodon densirostris]|uniref:WD repeat-containing protein 88 n=1 Tax=Mesoplodon densirostris TaxID=48708 RepID=UPI0028DC333C|nr:WD repeat-containing protein 88 [Mesoplodon densirostris]
MASQPPGAPSPTKALDEDGKTALRRSNVQLSSVHIRDGAHRPRKLPWVALVRACGRFKLSLLEARRGRLLPSLNPLAVGNDLAPPEKHWMPEKAAFWGDQEPLSKIPFKIMKGHQHIVSSCHFCVDDTKVLSGSYDCTVKLWDAVDGSLVRNFEPGPGAPVVECSVTADSRRIIAASYDKTVRAWDLETGKLLWKLSHETFIVSCKFSPDGKYVVSGLDVDRGICITDAEDTTTVSHIKDHHRMSVTACCFDPDSQKVASVSLDRSIKIWDVASQATLLTITKAHTNAISNCCFTFSGHFLCTSSWDKTLKIWNVHTGEFRNRGACATLMQGHEGSVSSCHFARDASLLVSGGFDKTVAIWDVGEGYRKLSLKGHNDWVMDVAISSNKKWILSASKDKTMRLWNIEEIDQIPLVIEYKKARGLKLKQCEECDRPFSIYESDIFSEAITKCVFCRIDAKDLSTEASPSPEGEVSPSRECSLACGRGGQPASQAEGASVMGPTRGHCRTTAGLSPDPTLGSRQPGRASGPWISGPGRGLASPDSLRQFWRAKDQILSEHSPKRFLELRGILDSASGAEGTSPGGGAGLPACRGNTPGVRDAPQGEQPAQVPPPLRWEAEPRHFSVDFFWKRPTGPDTSHIGLLTYSPLSSHAIRIIIPQTED